MAARRAGLALLVGSIPFALLGIAFGYWLPPRAALPVANILYLPLAVGGFLWMRPDERVPHDVDVASQLLPTRSWMEVLDPIATGDHPSRSTTSPRSEHGAPCSSRSPGGATAATRASASRERRHQTERRSAGDVLRRRGTRVRRRTGPRDDGLCNVVELGLGDAEVAQAVEPAEPRELLDPRRRVVGAERRPRSGRPRRGRPRR